MSKLKRLINQLNQQEYNTIYDALMQSDALKSAQLLKLFRENKLDDRQIKSKLEVNNNAFYTLRSRLNEKIESYILKESESPRNTLIKQVANIGEILLTKNKTIAHATLKKLEKELIDYDLSNELTAVYKALKKLNLHEENFFEYSQLYNKHVAYMLATDRVEDHLADYFKKYNQQLIDFTKEQDFSLKLLKDEITNTTQLYHSHRLNIYLHCCCIFHYLFVEDDILKKKKEYIQKAFAEIEDTIMTYKQDTLYHNLNGVLFYLKALHAYRMKDHDFLDYLLDHCNKFVDKLINNYGFYTSPIPLFIVKIERAIELGEEKKLYLQNKKLYKIEISDPTNHPIYASYTSFLALCAMLSDKHDLAIDLIDIFFKEINLKDNIYYFIDMKLLQAYCQLHTQQKEALVSTVNYLQRQIRIQGKENCEHSYLLLKFIKSTLSDIDQSKRLKKMRTYMEEFNDCKKPFGSPIRFIEVDYEHFEKPEYVIEEN